MGRLDDGIGPASLIVVDRNGVTRKVVLERISAGEEQAGTQEEPVYGMAWPAIAADPRSRLFQVETGRFSLRGCEPQKLQMHAGSE